MSRTIVDARRAYLSQLPEGRLKDDVDAALASLPNVCRFVEPLFLEGSTATRLREATRSLVDALESLYQRCRTDTGVRSKLALPPHLDALFDIETAQPPPFFIGRADGLLEGGVPRLIEFNGVPGGIPMTQSLARAFQGLAPTRDLGMRVECSAAVDRARAAVQLLGAGMNLGRPPVYGVVDTAVDAEALPSFLETACDVVRGSASDAKIVGGRLELAGRAIDIVHVEDWTKIEEAGYVHPIVEALALGLLPLHNGGARSVVYECKAAFAVLTDPEASAFLGADVHAALAGTLPWTRVLADTRTTFEGAEVSLLHVVEAQRERFVIKPCNSFTGDDVFLGWRCSASEWAEATERLLRRGAVVQERVVCDRAQLRGLDGSESSHEFDVCPYAWAGGVVDGIQTRIAGPSGHHNYARGATHAATIVV